MSWLDSRKIFDDTVTEFAVLDNVHPPEGYRLGTGDSLNITLVGNEEARYREK